MPSLVRLVTFFLFFVVVASSRDDIIRYIWHVTDPHIDPKYKEGSDPFCDGSDCCHEKKPHQKASAGKFGALTGHCETPPETWNGTLQFMRDYAHQHHFNAGLSDGVLMSGDFPRHGSAEDRAAVLRAVGLGFGMLEQHFPASTTEKNHDEYPADQLCYPPKHPDPLAAQCSTWITDPFGQYLSTWFDAPTIEFFKKNVYFSSVLPSDPNVKVIALNTQWTSATNMYMLGYEWTSHHPMTKWLRSEVSSWAAKGGKVILLGHIPPGEEYDSGRAYGTWNTDYVSILRDFHDHVLFTSWGHEHIDRWFLTRNKSEPIVINFACPPVTTRGHFPSVRLYSYNASSLTLLDVQTFTNDLEASNKAGSMTGNWKEYSMKTDYGMKDLSPASFDELVSRMEHDEKLFQLYIDHLHANGKTGHSCDHDCRKKAFCRMRYTLNGSYEDCMWK